MQSPGIIENFTGEPGIHQNGSVRALDDYAGVPDEANFHLVLPLIALKVSSLSAYPRFMRRAPGGRGN